VQKVACSGRSRRRCRRTGGRNSGWFLPSEELEEDMQSVMRDGVITRGPHTVVKPGLW